MSQGTQISVNIAINTDGSVGRHLTSATQFRQPPWPGFSSAFYICFRCLEEERRFGRMNKTFLPFVSVIFIFLRDCGVKPRVVG